MSSPENRTAVEASREFKVESEYNFPEIAELETSFVALLEELKEGIDQNRWPVLISDDGGGRIPTLVLRKIIEARTGTAPQTFFIAGGRYTPEIGRYSLEMKEGENEKIFVEYLKEIKKRIGGSRVLLTTQYMESGKSMLKIVHHMKRAGFDDVDIAALSTARRYTFVENFRVYSAEPLQDTIRNDHEHLSGVQKNWNEYQPHPMSSVQSIMHQGRILPLDRLIEIFDIDPRTDTRDSALEKRKDPAKIALYDKERFAPLSEKETADIQEGIRLAREDVSLLAKRVIERVWAK